MTEINERIEELAEELSSLCSKNNTGCLVLCIKEHKIIRASNVQGERFLASLEAKAEKNNGGIDLDNIRGSTAFALGVFQAAGAKA